MKNIIVIAYSINMHSFNHNSKCNLIADPPYDVLGIYTHDRLPYNNWDYIPQI